MLRSRIEIVEHLDVVLFDLVVVDRGLLELFDLRVVQGFVLHADVVVGVDLPSFRDVRFQLDSVMKKPVTLNFSLAL